MSTSKVDSNGRLVVPNAKPGDVFDVQQQGPGRYLLVRLEKPAHTPIGKDAALKAIDAHPLTPSMSWESLRTTTREP